MKASEQQRDQMIEEDAQEAFNSLDSDTQQSVADDFIEQKSDDIRDIVYESDNQRVDPRFKDLWEGFLDDALKDIDPSKFGIDEENQEQRKDSEKSE